MKVTGSRIALLLFLVSLGCLFVAWRVGIVGIDLWHIFLVSRPVQTVSKPFVSTRPDGISRTLINGDKRLKDLIDKPIDKNKIEIHIDKSEYKLSVVYKDEIIKEYPVVLGPDPVNDKLKEGDGRTPEGEFRVQDLYPHPSWSKFIWLNYPTKESWKKHNQAIAKGIIGKNDGIGGEIGIHGVPPGDDRLIAEGINWTHGCVSLTRKGVNEIYEVLQVGTRIEITH